MSDFHISTFDYNQTSSDFNSFFKFWLFDLRFVICGFVLSLVLKLTKMVIPPEKAIFYAGKSTPINFPLVLKLRAIFLVYPIR